MFRLNFFLVLFLVLVATTVFIPSFVVAETLSASRSAWSGYWWPYVNGGLATGIDYRGHPAPLEKYELLTDGFLSGRLVYPYREKYYDPAAPGWYGLCYAWAAASSFEIEPAQPSVHDNILFRVGDKKGLYTLAHTDDLRVYGDGEDPQQFHQWLIDIVGDQQKIFSADLDPGDEVWSYPIYAYEMTYGPRVGDQQAVLVVISYATDFVTQDYVGTDSRFHEYTYQLTFDGMGQVVDAEWTGASLTDHPQLMTFVKEQRSIFTGLDYVTVKQLGTAVDDEWERAGTSLLPPGTYQMISLNQDRYRLLGKEGDILTLDVEKLNGPENPLTVQVQDTYGTVLDEFTLTDSGEHLSWQLSGSLDHNYYVNLQQQTTGDADFYQLDFNRHSLLGEVLLPYIPNNGWWNGFAITNMGDDDVNNLCLTSLDFSGEALQSHIGSETLSARSKILTLFSSLPARSYEHSERETLSLLAPEQVAIVNLFGGSENGLGGFFSGHASPVKRLQLPFSSADWSELTWGGVINRSSVEQTIICSVYRSDGTLLDADTVVLLPNQKLRLSSIGAVSALPADGWLDFSVQSEENCLEGYQLWRSLSDTTKLEGVRGLIPAQVQWLPHVDNAGIWSTQLTVINPQDSDLTLTLSFVGEIEVVTQNIILGPHEKRNLSLDVLFSSAGSDLTSVSIKVEGTLDFSSYVSYQTADDLACIPLLQQYQLSQKLVLPHLSVEGGWWTGVVLFNPMATPVEITLTPVKSDGSRWFEQQKTVSLPGGAKKAFSVGQYWSSDVAEQLSYIEFTAASGQQIGGLFLFGRNGAQQVAGSILPSL